SLRTCVRGRADWQLTTIPVFPVPGGPMTNSQTGSSCPKRWQMWTQKDISRASRSGSEYQWFRWVFSALQRASTSAVVITGIPGASSGLARAGSEVPTLPRPYFAALRSLVLETRPPLGIVYRRWADCKGKIALDIPAPGGPV